MLEAQTASRSPICGKEKGEIVGIHGGVIVVRFPGDPIMVPVGDLIFRRMLNEFGD
jgi:hypothetical protein